MCALFKQFKLILAQSHLPIHFKHTLSRIIEAIETHRFKLQVPRVASQQIKRLRLILFRMFLHHTWFSSSLFICNDLFSANIEVLIEKYELLIVGNIINLFEVEVYLHSSDVTRSYSFRKSLSVNLGIFAIN